MLARLASINISIYPATNSKCLLLLSENRLHYYDMYKTTMEKNKHHTEHVKDHTMNTTEQLPTPQMKHNSKGVVLIPQPSDDPRDPLVGEPSYIQNAVR